MKKDNVELICSISELSNLFKGKTNIQGFLDKVTSTVSDHMKCDSCSIFILDDNEEVLILEATEGLNKDFIGELRLKPGEGLVGLALKEERTFLEKDGIDNPKFQKVTGFGEEAYNAFLAVPILSGLSKIGVIVLEHSRKDYFNSNDLMALKAIASQLATTLENVKLLISLNEKKSTHKGNLQENCHIKGIATDSGVGFGRAFIMGDIHSSLLLNAEDILYGKDLKAFNLSLSKTVSQVEELQKRLERDHSDVASMIFSTHLLMLNDSSFSGEMVLLIEGGEIPSNAIVTIVNKYIKIFSESDNPRLQEKVQDIKDLGHRLLRNLSEVVYQEGDYSEQIVVARELLPSELIKITAQHAEGLVLFGGGATAHITILAKSLGVPIIFTDDRRIFKINENTQLIVDANEGHLFVNPNKGTIRKYKRNKAGSIYTQEQIDKVKEKTFTSDGKRIKLYANINLLSDLKNATIFKAEGVGLYRSEFPFIIRNNFPSEEEQFQIYRKLIETSPGNEATLRTLDIGGDKILSYIKDIEEENPFLGLRAIRFLLKNRTIFITQLKAMLRAGAGRDLKIMFPLVSSLDDLLMAKEVVEESLKYLDRDGVEYNNHPKIGVMIELPSAVFVIDEICKEADFISIGTNDLVQYLIGVDRSNDHVAWLYTAKHPAVMRALKAISVGAKKAKCDISVCGNIAGDEELIKILIGLGITKFSMNPVKIPSIQRTIETINSIEATVEADNLLKLGQVEEIREYFNQKK